jgi:KamA family protein
VDCGLLQLFVNSRLQAVLVVHANHPREIDTAVGRALQRLATAGVTLLNQSVLLKGVNDSAKVLIALSDSIFKFRVIPYYLHLLDRVSGTAHFEVEEQRALSIMEAMRNSLPGYLVPRLVREQAGQLAKIRLA